MAKYKITSIPQYSDGGIFKKRRNKNSLDYTSWSGTSRNLNEPAQMFQSEEDAFALPISSAVPNALITLPDYGSMFPGWTPQEIQQYYNEQEFLDKKREKLAAYKPFTNTFKNLNRPKANFVLAEDMSEEFLKTLKDSGFYTLKTSSGDYEVFSNKDIADLIYKKGITPSELSTEFKLGDSKTLKSHFEPVYTNASLIHAKRNKEKIDKLITEGNTKKEAINKLVKQGEGTVNGLTKLYGEYTQAAYDKNQDEINALINAGASDIGNLTDYQKQMYLNIKNFENKEGQKVFELNKDVEWRPWAIQPGESTALRNRQGFWTTDPVTGKEKYNQPSNSTAYEKNEAKKFLVEQELEKFRNTAFMQAEAARAILGSKSLNDKQRKKFLENPEEFNKILKSFVDYSVATPGMIDQKLPQNSGEYRYTPGIKKSDFSVTPEGAKWYPGRYGKGSYIDGPVNMLYPEKYFIGPGGGLLGAGFRGLNRVLEYPLLSAVGSEAAPWLTAGNALNAYMGYETVKPGGLISQSVEGFKEGDMLKGWGNAGLSALNLVPFVGPTAQSLKYLNNLSKIENVGDFQGVTQAGLGNLFKSTANSIVDAETLQTLKANNYQGASDDLLTKLIQKKKGEMRKGIFSNQMTMDEDLILSANKDRVAELVKGVEAPVAPTPEPPTGVLGKTYQKGKDLVSGASEKVGTVVSTPAKNWWETMKSDLSNSSLLEKIAPFRPLNRQSSPINTTVTATAAQNTTKYQTVDEIAQSMYGAKYDDLSGLAKSQVDKAFKAQPLPSGASTSAQGSASAVTNVSDDVLLKNKISQQKYGQDYDKVSSWAQTAVDKEFQAAKLAEQQASAANQVKNAAETNAAEQSGNWGDWIDNNSLMGGLAIGAAATSDNENSDAMLAGLPFFFLTKGKAKLTPAQLKYLRLAGSAATETSPLKNAAVMSADAGNIKTFLEGEAINKGLGAAKETEGAFNMGIFNVKDEPGLIAKIEHPATVGAKRGMPDYENVNMAEAMQNISGPTFGKVHHQVVSPTTGNRALILNRLEGTPYNELTMDDFLNLSDDAIAKFHDDVQTLKRNNLGFDFTGNNYVFDRNTNQFKLFDIDPHTTVFDPKNKETFNFFQNTVYGGGNPLLYGSKTAGRNLQSALKERLQRDLIWKMSDAGVDFRDTFGVIKDYDNRINNILKDLNYKEDGGYIETDVDPDVLENLLALGYNVQEI